MTHTKTNYQIINYLKSMGVPVESLKSIKWDSTNHTPISNNFVDFITADFNSEYETFELLFNNGDTYDCDIHITHRGIFNNLVSRQTSIVL